MGNNLKKKDAQSWNTFNNFPTLKVRSFPFQTRKGDKLIYCTSYQQIKPKHSGIFEYDIQTDTHKTILLWESISFYPQSYTAIYNKKYDSIIFVGGKNLELHKNSKDVPLSKIIMFYNLTDKTIKKIDIDVIIGLWPSLLFTNNNDILHIIGGDENDYHITYNITDNKIHLIHSFKNTNPLIYGHGIIYNKSINSIMVFGGYSYQTYECFTDFWILNLNDNIALLSMEQRSKYLINRYMIDTFLKVTDNYRYPKELNNIILKYFGILPSKWKRNDKYKMKPICGFGYILYKQQFIVVFGGMTAEGMRLDDIYYIDVLSDTATWIKTTIKCPARGGCNAILINDQTVHLLPYNSYSNHFSINIGDILPTLDTKCSIK